MPYLASTSLISLFYPGGELSLARTSVKTATRSLNCLLFSFTSAMTFDCRDFRRVISPSFIFTVSSSFYLWCILAKGTSTMQVSFKRASSSSFFSLSDPVLDTLAFTLASFMYLIFSLSFAISRSYSMM